MLLDEEVGFSECPEHGLYPEEYFFCPGCEAVEHDIDEAIEQQKEREVENE